MKILILAGGGGTRLWPLSRSHSPKQFQPLLNSKSLLEETALRARKLTAWKNIYVVAPEQYHKEIFKHVPKLPHKNLILEPAPRNTAPCIGLGVVHLVQEKPNDVLVVLPSDHFIQKENQFKQTIRKAVKLASTGEYLVTLGIKPTYPETGYGYIRAGEKFKFGSSLVKKFLEKPNKAVAQRFINQGEYFWNSGMFIFRLDLMLDAFSALMPKTYEALLNTELLLKKKQTKKANQAFEKCEKISIDYGILEKFQPILVVPSYFGWSDLGSFAALQKVLAKDSQGNVLGDSLMIESSNCFVKNNRKKLVSLIGLDHVGVIETNDVLLVCDLKQSQKVKDLLEKLKRNKKYRRLI